MSQQIEIEGKTITLTDEVETVYEAEIKSHGNSARVGVPKRWIGKRAYVIVLKG